MPEPKLLLIAPRGDYTLKRCALRSLRRFLDAVGGLRLVKPGMRIGIKPTLRGEKAGAGGDDPSGHGCGAHAPSRERGAEVVRRQPR